MTISTAQGGPVPGRGRAELLVLFGPTGSGKSALALRLAQALDGEIVNADSMQVYRDLAILSARPTAAETALVPHRLYGHVDGARRHSAAAWAAEAAAAVAEIHAAGRLPILVGGTGLYFATLLDGIAEIPDVPDEVLAATERLYAELGGVAFRDRLAERDPELASRLPPGDRQRLVRALAVAEATGRPLAAWQRMPARPLLDLPAAGIVLLPERAALYRRCDRRLEEMVQAGALEEVRALLARGLSPGLPVMKAVGVPHFAALLRGELPAEAALALAQRDTRRYAKRQCTWIRHRGVARAVPDPLLLPAAPWSPGWAAQEAVLQDFLRARFGRGG